jgi:flagellar biosynthesis protein FlhG
MDAPKQDTPEREIRNPVIFSLTSGKGGVGKTNLTVNLAFALSQRNHRVLVVDGDLGLANVDVLLRINVRRTLRDVMESGDDPTSALVSVEPNVAVLPSSSGVPQMLTLGVKEQSVLLKILKNITQGFDFVLVDTAAGIGPSVLWLNSFADYNIVVVTPDPTSMTDAYALIKVLYREHGRKDFYILLNLVADEREGLETFNKLSSAAVRFLDIRPKFLGSIPDDPLVTRSVRDQVPVVRRSPQSKAALAIQELARRISIFGKSGLSE